MADVSTDDISVAKPSALSINAKGLDLKNVLKDSWQACADVGTDVFSDIALNQAMSGGDIAGLVVDFVMLAGSVGELMYHNSCMKKQLALCLAEYGAAGYLDMQRDSVEPRFSKWTVTPKFHKENFLLKVYKDIARYVHQQGITTAELDVLEWKAGITIHAQKSLPHVTKQLSEFCNSVGMRDITKTDLNKRLNNVSFGKIGSISFTNACIVEGERRKRRERDDLPPDPRVIPVLGRVLALVAICGIREINVADIVTLVGKAPMFETVARARVADLRGHHASQIINTQLFGGSTESAARQFAERAVDFRDERVVVGRVEEKGIVRFYMPWVQARCQFSQSIDTSIPYGTSVYMLAGWAKLIQQRENFEFKRIKFVITATGQIDVHGNNYKRMDELSKLLFGVEMLSDGTLMAKPEKFGTWAYQGPARYQRGSAKTTASGEEKHFGGLVGPVNCGCVADEIKGRLVQTNRYGNELKILNNSVVHNSIQHTKDLSKKCVSILWHTGDWPIGVLMMQILPHSSYLQGRGECLYCAVENAALAGCPEVIACGGGRVSEEARAKESPEPHFTPVFTPPTEPGPLVTGFPAHWLVPHDDSTPSSVSLPTKPLTPQTSIASSRTSISSPAQTLSSTSGSYFAAGDIDRERSSLSSLAAVRPVSVAIRRKPILSPTIPISAENVNQAEPGQGLQRSLSSYSATSSTQPGHGSSQFGSDQVSVSSDQKSENITPAVQNIKRKSVGQPSSVAGTGPQGSSRHSSYSGMTPVEVSYGVPEIISEQRQVCDEKSESIVTSIPVVKRKSVKQASSSTSSSSTTEDDKNEFRVRVASCPVILTTEISHGTPELVPDQSLVSDQKSESVVTSIQAVTGIPLDDPKSEGLVTTIRMVKRKPVQSVAVA